uniref:Putative secreted protein n=1 Tax=Xenopsylla cheopis TaxID=163159 RepID=A0A6M2DWA8_XENCH
MLKIQFLYILLLELTKTNNAVPKKYIFLNSIRPHLIRTYHLLFIGVSFNRRTAPTDSGACDKRTVFRNNN